LTRAPAQTPPLYYASVSADAVLPLFISTHLVCLAGLACASALWLKPNTVTLVYWLVPPPLGIISLPRPASHASRAFFFVLDWTNQSGGGWVISSHCHHLPPLVLAGPSFASDERRLRSELRHPPHCFFFAGDLLSLCIDGRMVQAPCCGLRHNKSLNLPFGLPLVIKAFFRFLLTSTPHIATSLQYAYSVTVALHATRDLPHRKKQFSSPLSPPPLFPPLKLFES
jgi:hypothetical protein